MGRGIDYGSGLANIDRKTGIRFGVISSHDITQSWADSSEPDYGPATCPKCGNEATELGGKAPRGYSHVNSWIDRLIERPTGGEWKCKGCKVFGDSDEFYGESPVRHVLDDGEYKATQRGDDSDVFVLLSPFFTRAAFCSPCAPGACHLAHPCDDGERAYCFGHDWFDEGKAPYPVYSVATGELVPAPIS